MALYVCESTTFGITLHWPLLLGLLVSMSWPGRIRPAFPLLPPAFPRDEVVWMDRDPSDEPGEQDRGRVCTVVVSRKVSMCVQVSVHVVTIPRRDICWRRTTFPHLNHTTEGGKELFSLQISGLLMSFWSIHPRVSEVNSCIGSCEPMLSSGEMGRVWRS